MPDAIWIIVTVQTVPGLKYLCTWPTTGTAPAAASPAISSTFLRVFICVLAFLWRLLVDRPGAEPRCVPRSSAKENFFWNLDVWTPPTAGAGRQRPREISTSGPAYGIW